MSEPGEKDDSMAQRAARLMPGTTVAPKHLRIIGGYFLFACAFMAGVNVFAARSGSLYPKVMIITPTLLLIGLWLLLDGRALAAGTRRRQQAIMWVLVAVGSALGVAIIHRLTGRFF